MQKGTLALRVIRSALFIATVGWLAVAPARAGQIDTATFIRIDTGMAESEVLIRAGAPDLVTSSGGDVLESIDGRYVSRGAKIRRFGTRGVLVSNVQRWHYIPDSSEHDPHLTIITMRNGWVFNIERKKILSRAGLPKPPSESLDKRETLSDDEIVRRRLARTLDAAEHYARTRSRLKREEIELARAAADLPELTVENSDERVYRSLDETGVVYYGDRPPNASRLNIIDY